MNESGSFVADPSATTRNGLGNRFFKTEFESCVHRDVNTGALKSEQL
jgi:hypothetical protein